MRIEMFGPSGVGKSTIVKTVQPLLGDTVIFPEDLPHATPQLHQAACAKDHIFEGNKSLNQFLSFAASAIYLTDTMFEQKSCALRMLHENTLQYIISDIASTDDNLLLHDELFLQRGMSFLQFLDNAEKYARLYYEKAPAPDVAIICRAHATVIMNRNRGRGEYRNCYKGLQANALRASIHKVLAICAIAGDTLARRGIAVRTIDTSGSPEASALQISNIIREFSTSDHQDTLKARTMASCRSFRKKTGRHHLRTPDVIYCAFTTSNFTVHRSEAQRDAAIRFEQFGLNQTTLQGKRVLDLGSNIGAMLFQASNYAIAEGLGIEYDHDKVMIAQEIARLSQLDSLSFVQGDIDTLNANQLGTFDVTFAFAVESHVNDPNRLYGLLGDVTKEVLYFEGNGGCDVVKATESLRRAGFSHVEYLGVCMDDIVPDNNRRPLLRAVK